MILYLRMRPGRISRRNTLKANKEAAEGFEEDNPLANSSHYEIYLNDVSMQKDGYLFEGLRRRA